MFELSIIIVAAFLSFTSAKTCTNITIPISINARNGDFNIPPLSTAIAVPKFAQDFLRRGQNYSEYTLSGFIAQPVNIAFQQQFVYQIN